MAISVLPVDGLINRLIQQNQRPASRPSGTSSEPGTLQDKVNISSQAKAHASGANDQAGQAATGGQTASQDQTPSPLESKLLEMYKIHSGGRS